MKLQRLVLFALATLFAVSSYADNRPTQAEPGSVRGIRREQFKAYREASRRVETAVREGNRPTETDLRWEAAGRMAVIAGDVREVTLIKPLKRLETIAAPWVKEAEEASGRILVAFNSSGDRAEYSESDERLLHRFFHAVIAADRLRYDTHSAVTAGIPHEVAQVGLEAAERILTTFNELGGKAEFAVSDLDALMRLDKAVDTVEGPHQ